MQVSPRLEPLAYGRTEAAAPADDRLGDCDDCAPDDCDPNLAPDGCCFAGPPARSGEVFASACASAGAPTSLFTRSSDLGPDAAPAGPHDCKTDCGLDASGFFPPAWTGEVPVSSCASAGTPTSPLTRSSLLSSASLPLPAAASRPLLSGARSQCDAGSGLHQRERCSA